MNFAFISLPGVGPELHQVLKRTLDIEPLRAGRTFRLYVGSMECESPSVNESKFLTSIPCGLEDGWLL